ncbi:MAG: N-acetylmuramate alpha-1-phosphate uridylyltransferase MurU [Porticoccaceae bacterium]
MKAMILAAGRGERLRPLTDTTPKPMLPIDGKPLLEHHINQLAAAGITEIVINTCWLGEQIEEYFDDSGRRFGVNISWSREAQALETGGGISHALPLLGDQPFLLINGDVWSDFPLTELSKTNLPAELDAQLVLVNNPEHHPQGDFSLDGNLVGYREAQRFTFSGISLFRPALFAAYQASAGQCFPLRDILRPAILAGRVGGSVYTGSWCDVGTVERYRQLQTLVSSI